MLELTQEEINLAHSCVRDKISRLEAENTRLSQLERPNRNKLDGIRWTLIQLRPLLEKLSEYAIQAQ